MNDTVSEDVKVDTDGLEAALDEAKYWDEGFTSSPREYQVLRIVGDEVETISRHPDRASMESALYAARMSACIRAYLASTKPPLADVTVKANDPHFYQLTDGSFAPYPHGMTEDEWNAQIGGPSYEHAKDLPSD